MGNGCLNIFNPLNLVIFTYSRLIHIHRSTQGRARRSKYWPTRRRRPAISLSSRSSTANEMSTGKFAVWLVWIALNVPCLNWAGLVIINTKTKKKKALGNPTSPPPPCAPLLPSLTLLFFLCLTFYLCTMCCTRNTAPSQCVDSMALFLLPLVPMSSCSFPMHPPPTQTLARAASHGRDR